MDAVTVLPASFIQVYTLVTGTYTLTSDITVTIYPECSITGPLTFVKELMVNETATYNLDGFEDVGCPMNFTIVSPSEYPEITLESPTYAPATSQYPFALNV